MKRLFAAMFALMLMVSAIGCSYRGGETGIKPRSGNDNRMLSTPIPPNMGREGVNVRLHGNGSS
ncbi:hypothetical protein [Gorillibacterium massiliense]|uniref:hypothetical protein n=1 Tax=Gorillibacterium massiliense TaxID=1280390 RepID=UPI001EE396F6|nr:hypothetical protein [Gorillibacterium massiliense]